MRAWFARQAQRFRNTCIWSWQGWRAAWATESSLRQWTLANVASAGLALSLDLDGGERGLILAAGLLVLAAELANTAIEEVVDLVCPEENPRARKAKDCGSACVALAAFAAGAAWAAVLIG